jgi:hypothetical protein
LQRKNCEFFSGLKIFINILIIDTFFFTVLSSTIFYSIFLTKILKSKQIIMEIQLQFHVICTCRIIDYICWVKISAHGKIAVSNGFYLQHGYSICVIGQKGYVTSDCVNFHQISDVIFDYRAKQSQKTNQIYDLIENFFPHSRCIELFGRHNNLRNNWFTLGNQIFRFFFFFLSSHLFVIFL